jgi:hypothetical protein
MFLVLLVLPKAEPAVVLNQLRIGQLVIAGFFQSQQQPLATRRAHRSAQVSHSEPCWSPQFGSKAKLEEHLCCR